MNGSTHSVANVVDIQLKRGPSGKIEKLLQWNATATSYLAAVASSLQTAFLMK